MDDVTIARQRDPSRDPSGDSYDASSIAVLAGLQAVRRRPAMYIGSTDIEGVHHLVYEVFQNAVDEVMAGACSRIKVAIHDDGSCSVEDDGRGIPVGIHPEKGRPACEVVLTTLHAGGKFGQHNYRLAGGTHGVGLSVVNALSEWLTLDVWRRGMHFRQSFGRGEALSQLAEIGPTSRRGTRIQFLPDEEIFQAGITIDPAELTRRLREQAFLHPGLEVHFEPGAGSEVEFYRHDSGLPGFVEYLNAQRIALHTSPIHLQGARDGVSVDVALQWTTAYSEDISTYVNSIFTPHGGTHLEGLKSSLTRVFHRYALRHQLLKASSGEKITGYDIREGLTCVVSVTMSEPLFRGQTKTELTSPAAGAAVEEIAKEQLTLYLDEHPEVAAAIVGKAVEAFRARAAARRASEGARYQSPHSVVSKEVYRTQFGIRSRNWHASARWITDAELLAAHARACKVSTEAKVLDVCCGSGVVGASFRDRVGSLVGLDLTPAMIELAKERLDEIHRGDVYDIPFAEGTYDLVVNREVLHLLPRPERPVSEIFRVLKPGGQFIVGQLLPYGALDAPWMFRLLKKKQPLFFNNFTEEDFVQLLRGAGFVDIEVTEHLQWEDIDLWIDTHETPNLHRHEIRDLYYNAPAEVRATHPFEILPSGAIRDCWRWCIFSAMKPSE